MSGQTLGTSTTILRPGIALLVYLRSSRVVIGEGKGGDEERLSLCFKSSGSLWNWPDPTQLWPGLN